MNLKEKIEKINRALKIIDDNYAEFQRTKQSEEHLEPDEWIHGKTRKMMDTIFEPAINDTIIELKEVVTFFHDFETEIKNNYIRKLLSDREDLSDVTEEDVRKFYAVIQNDEAYNNFINEVLPKNLSDYLSQVEYDELKEETLTQSELLKTSLDDIFRKAVLEPDLDNPEARQAFFNRIVNEMIEEDKNCLEKQQSEDNNLKFNPDLGITEKLLNKKSDNQPK